MSPGVSPEARDVDEVIDRVARVMMSIRFGSDAVAKGFAPTATAASTSGERSHANGEKYASHRHEDPPIRLRRGSLMHGVNVLG